MLGITKRRDGTVWFRYQPYQRALRTPTSGVNRYERFWKDTTVVVQALSIVVDEPEQVFSTSRELDTHSIGGFCLAALRRLFSDNPVGGFLTKTPASSSAYARQALSLPPGNQATYIQEVVVPAGTRLQRSRALAVEKWGTRGGAEQFQLLDQIPFKNFGPPRRLQ